MPIPNAVSTRLVSALTSVDATTSLDLLISLIDVGQRSGLDISAASAELVRRANLVDSNTSSIEASKIAAGLFKIDYPVTDLWTGASEVGGGGIDVGQLVSGYFTGNPKYVPANGGRYLLSAYPDMTTLVNAGAVVSVSEPALVDPLLMNGKTDATTYKEQYLYTDADVIIVPQQAHASNVQGYLLLISPDAGQTWNPCLPKALITASNMPEAANAGLTNAHVLSVCKLDQPGSYGIILATAITSGNIYYAYTTDYGITWQGWGLITSGVNVNSSRHSVYFRNGALLYIGPAMARYSIDKGAVWTQLTNTQFTGSNNLSLQHTLSDDGYLIYSNNTTSLIYLEWPANIGGWAANIAFTTVTAKLPAARTFIKKCGNSWVAFSTTSGVIYHSSTLLGTYAARSLTGLNGVRDVEYVNGNFYLIANSATTGWNIYHTPTLGTTGGGAVIAQSVFPAFGNGTAAFRWPLISTGFQINLSTPTYIYYKHGRESIARTTTPDTSGTSQVFGTTPTLFPHFCRKYNMWFCSVYTHDTYPSITAVGTIDLAATVLHYRSTDGKNWFGIGTGRSGIVDAGSRLLRLTASGVLEQSTDGIIWDTTGITRPGIGTVGAARLWRCKNAIYYYTSQNAASSTGSFLYVSLDAGVSWSAVVGITSPGMVALTKGSMVYYNGKYYCWCVYQSVSPTTVQASVVDTPQILQSTDGITFTSVYSTSQSAGLFQPNECGFVLYRGQLYCLAGFINNNTQNLSLVTGDGRTYSSAANSALVVAIQSADIWDFDYSNGDQRTIREKTISVPNSSYSAPGIEVYKGETLEATILFASGSSASKISSIGGADGYLMGVVNWAAYLYTPATIAFIAPTPNSGTSPMPSPFMRVAN